MFIGNDIVDLSENRNPHPRFPRRIFSDAELFRYEQVNPTVRQVEYLWTAWAAKEAAYKLEKQRDQSIYFSPREFEVDVLQKTVKWRGRIHLYESLINAEFLHVWTSECTGKIITGWKKPDIKAGHDWQSIAVRSLARELIADELKVDHSRIAFDTYAGKIPRVLVTDGSGAQSALSECKISLSHDGSYVAVAVGFS